jgi:uncharacterized protein YbjT (DUF2867 family)
LLALRQEAPLAAVPRRTDQAGFMTVSRAKGSHRFENSKRQRGPPYSRVKLAAEELVKGSAVPWSIVRATGFYWLLERMLEKMAKRRIMMLPADVRMQAVDSDEFANFVVACTSDDLRGERKDFVGPETLTMRQLAEQYLAAHGLHRRVWKAPMPRRIKTSLDAGNTSANALHGTTTWAAWLARSPSTTAAAAHDEPRIAHEQSQAVTR